MGGRRRNRLELLPASTDRAVALVLDQVITRRSMTQSDGLAAINETLAALGVTELSHSGFCRALAAIGTAVPARWRLNAAADPAADIFTTAQMAWIDRRIADALRQAGPTSSRKT